VANGEWFAGRLRELREAAGLTQAELATKAGLTREGVAQLEVGRRKPAWETVLALCAALGCSCEAFAQPPAERPPPGLGRPRKPEAAAPAPKRPRGRPRKDQAADLPPAQGKPARRKPPRARGG
jgi:DNA-binding XRE family transcriptional regulator